MKRYAGIAIIFAGNGMLTWLWPGSAWVGLDPVISALAILGGSVIEYELLYHAIRIGAQAERETRRLNAELRAMRSIGPAHAQAQTRR